MISIGTVYNNLATYEAFLEPSLDKVDRLVNRLILDNTENALTTKLASIYNSFLRLAGPDLLAFLHPDVSFQESFLHDLFAAIEFLEEAGKPWGRLGLSAELGMGNISGVMKLRSPRWCARSIRAVW